MPAAACFVSAVALAVWGMPGMILLTATAGALLCKGMRSRALVLAASLLGACVGSLWLHQALQSRVPEQATDQTFRAVGVVDSLPRRVPGFPGEPDGWRFDLQLSEPLHALPQVRRLRVSWYPQQPQWPCLGGQLQASLQVRPPRGLLDPYGPDTERSLLGQGIDGYGRVVAVHNLRQPGSDGGSCRAVRQRLSQDVRAAMAGSVAAAIVPALVVGDRRFLDDEHWLVLQRTGTAHLVAISGLHVSLVGWLAWWLARSLLAGPMALCSGRLDAGVLALLPAAAVAFGYAWLAGFSAPTLRALVMALLCFVVLAAGWRLSAARVLLAALAILTALQPGLVLMQGFWLSVLAVGLLVSLAGLPRPLLRGHALMTAGVGLLAGAWFSFWSLSSLLVNLLMVPLFSLVVIPLSLLASLVPGAGLLAPAVAWILDAVWAGLQHAARLPGLPLPASGWLLCALVVAAVLLLRPGLPGARHALPLLFVLLMPSLQQRPAAGEFDLLVFDVGQGQAIAVRTRNALMLYDTGPDPALARRHLLPWLLRQPQGERMLVVSHGDRDHAGGAAALTRALDFHWRLAGQPHRTPGSAACRRGQRWQFDGVTFEVLWPAPALEAGPANNYSCVVRVSNGTFSVLLTGDIEKQVEYWLLAHHLIPVDVATVPHHGSRSSSSFALIRQLSAKHVLVSAGWRNRFSHPADSVIERWHSFDAEVDNTAVQGAVEISSGGDVRRWRHESHYPWRQGPAVVE